MNRTESLKDQIEWLISLYMAVRPDEREIVERYHRHGVERDQFHRVIGRAIMTYLETAAAGSQRSSAASAAARN